MFGGEQRRQPNIPGTMQQVDGTATIRRDAGVVGDQPHSFPAYEVDRIREQDLNAKPHASLRVKRDGGRTRKERENRDRRCGQRRAAAETHSYLRKSSA